MLRTWSIYLIMLWIGYGFPGTTLTFSSRARPQMAVQPRHPIGNFWLSASTSLASRPPSSSPSGTVAFNKVVIPALATRGVGINSVPYSSGWSSKNISLNDPIEVALAGELQSSALAHVATSTSNAYVGPWNALVSWCNNFA